MCEWTAVRHSVDSLNYLIILRWRPVYFSKSLHHCIICSLSLPRLFSLRLLLSTLSFSLRCTSLQVRLSNNLDNLIVIINQPSIRLSQCTVKLYNIITFQNDLIHELHEDIINKLNTADSSQSKLPTYVFDFSHVCFEILLHFETCSNWFLPQTFVVPHFIKN